MALSCVCSATDHLGHVNQHAGGQPRTSMIIMGGPRKRFIPHLEGSSEVGSASEALDHEHDCDDGEVEDEEDHVADATPEAFILGRDSGFVLVG